MSEQSRGALARLAKTLGLTLAVLLNIHAVDAVAGQGKGRQIGANLTCPAIGNQITPTSGEAEQLSFMREEEKLARDVYLALNQRWQWPAFNNIAQSEQTHMDQVKCFLDAYGLPDPAKIEAGRFNNTVLQGLYDSLVARGQVSLSDALRVGGLIEEVDIRDLQLAIDSTGIAEVKVMYRNLMSGSENHLRAFASGLSGLGESYAAQVLSKQGVEDILGGSASVPGSGINIGSGAAIETRAQFTMELQTTLGRGVGMAITQQTDLVLNAKIQTDPAHVGRSARLVNVALYQPQGSRSVYSYQEVSPGEWQGWSGKTQDLAGPAVQLLSSHTQTLFSGALQNMPGYFQIYSGYCLDDGGLIFSSQPLSFGVLP